MGLAKKLGDSAARGSPSIADSATDSENTLEEMPKDYRLVLLQTCHQRSQLLQLHLGLVAAIKKNRLETRWYDFVSDTCLRDGATGLLKPKSYVYLCRKTLRKQLLEGVHTYRYCRLSVVSQAGILKRMQSSSAANSHLIVLVLTGLELSLYFNVFLEPEKVKVDLVETKLILLIGNGFVNQKVEDALAS